MCPTNFTNSADGSAACPVPSTGEEPWLERVIRVLRVCTQGPPKSHVGFNSSLVD